VIRKKQTKRVLLALAKSINEDGDGGDLVQQRVERAQLAEAEARQLLENAKRQVEELVEREST
jgi:hypothetical protein